MKNGIVLVTNDHYFQGLIATINSLKISNPDVGICVFDTGISEENLSKLLEKNIRVIDMKSINQELSGKVHFWQGSFMSDFSCFAQLFSWKSGFENILSLEVDTLVLSDLQYYFNQLSEHEFVGSMDDGFVKLLIPEYKWPFRFQMRFEECDRPQSGGQTFVTKVFNMTFRPGDPVEHNRMDEISRDLGLIDVDNYLSMNGGVFSAKASTFKEMCDLFPMLIRHGQSFQFLAQSYINLYLVYKKIKFHDMGSQWNLSGIGEIDGYESIYDLSKSTRKWSVDYPTEVRIENNQLFIQDKKIHIPHFCGSKKPWKLNKGLNKIIDLWYFYYNDGNLF